MVIGKKSNAHNSKEPSHFESRLKNYIYILHHALIANTCIYFQRNISFMKRKDISASNH